MAPYYPTGNSDEKSAHCPQHDEFIDAIVNAGKRQSGEESMRQKGIAEKTGDEFIDALRGIGAK